MCGTVPQSRLRQFAWTDDSVAAVRSRMVAHVPSDVLEGSRAPPVFCLQTALQMMLWCHIAYTYPCAPVTSLPSAYLASVHDNPRKELPQESEFLETLRSCPW